jgi:N-terminal domain of anti-restriction factor ArdC
MPERRTRRRLTEGERDARRQADRERIEQAARALLTTEGWKRWIRVRATNGLSRYSLRNQWLIACECHTRGITPTYVAGFRAFLALNRCVRRGETAIKILAPVAVKQRDVDGEKADEKRIIFRTVPVFDVSMTDPLPGVEPVPLTPPAEPIDGDSHDHLVAPLQELARELGYRVEIRELPETGPGGWYDSQRREMSWRAGRRTAKSARSSMSSPTRSASATTSTGAIRPKCSSTRSRTSSAPPSDSTSAASRSPTSPAGAKTAP